MQWFSSKKVCHGYSDDKIIALLTVRDSMDFVTCQSAYSKDSSYKLCKRLTNYHTSLTVPRPAPTPLAASLRFKFPILCTRLLPTASTAPIGFMRLGPRTASFSTLNRRTLVPFQTPTVPFCTTISEAKMKPQSRDSYQPKERGVHSKRWIRGGEGSIVEGRVVGGDVDESRVRIVWSGKEGSQVSICKCMLVVRSLDEHMEG